jgi:Predicted membrane protein (DUF2254)
MHDLLRRLVTRPQPGGCYRDDDGELRLVVPRYDTGDYLRLAVEEIWHHGHASPQVPAAQQPVRDPAAGEHPGQRAAPDDQDQRSGHRLADPVVAGGEDDGE